MSQVGPYQEYVAPLTELPVRVNDDPSQTGELFPVMLAVGWAVTVAVVAAVEVQVPL